MFLKSGEIAKLLNCPHAGNERLITNAVTDSRDVKDGSLFVCVEGNHVDGHDYAEKAEANGACAILASKQVNCKNIPVLLVADTIDALGKIAASWRKKTSAKVICLTGTCGKTTLKDTLATILGKASKIAITKKNHNNQIGLPCSMLAADGDEDFWILEAGISHAGDMDYLGAMVEPDLAIILNIGPGHTEGLGDKGVAWHKSRLLNHLAPEGQALISADYPELLDQIEPQMSKPVFFSTSKESVFPFHVKKNNGKGSYELALGNEIYSVNTPFMGEWGAEIAICAASCAKLLGVGQDIIKDAFEEIELPDQRFNQFKKGNWYIIDDTYNANPLSMKRMLASASALAKSLGLPFYAVLGEMGELGVEAKKWHYILGKNLASLCPEQICWKGEYFEDVKNGFMQNYSGNPEKAGRFAQIASSTNFEKEWISKIGNREKGGVIIFKGSRLNHLEDCVEVFINSLDRGIKNVL